jgi:hypothetical protein
MFCHLTLKATYLAFVCSCLGGEEANLGFQLQQNCICSQQASHVKKEVFLVQKSFLAFNDDFSLFSPNQKMINE